MRYCRVPETIRYSMYVARIMKCMNAPIDLLTLTDMIVVHSDTVNL